MPDDQDEKRSAATDAEPAATEAAPAAGTQPDTSAADAAAKGDKGDAAENGEKNAGRNELESRYQGLIKHLKRIDTFRPFSDEVLANQFLPMSKVLTFQAGDVVLKEGDLDNWVYFLINGQLKVVKRGVVLSQFNRQGDVFGEVSAIDGTPRSATVMALKQSTCLAIDLGKVDKLDKEAREAFTSILYRVFATKLAERLREAGAKIVKLEESLARLKPKA